MENSVLILHATQTGTAQDLALETYEHLKGLGISVSHLDVYEADVSILKKHPVCLLFASTWGEGEPPDDAVDFYEALAEADPLLRLDGLSFAVFGLGDSCYEEFNACGKNFDRMLEEQGAERMIARVDSDVDYEGPFDNWLHDVVPVVRACLLSKSLLV